jgi:hypothetical protein
VTRKIAWISLILIGFLWALIPSKIEPASTNVRLFCAYGRVFIEFEEKYNTWGTTWLDNRGKPVPCDEDGPLTDISTANII